MIKNQEEQLNSENLTLIESELVILNQTCETQE